MTTINPSIISTRIAAVWARMPPRGTQLPDGRLKNLLNRAANWLDIAESDVQAAKQTLASRRPSTVSTDCGLAAVVLAEGLLAKIRKSAKNRMLLKKHGHYVA